jgi:RNA polymerase sigma-70 factor (ECF subfamily)
MRTYNPAFAGFEDDVLVSMAQNGDNAAFTELVERHNPTCRRLALSILKNQEDAEDEVQNATWKAYQHLSGFNQDAKFSTWLSRIVVNQCLMRLRKDKRARFVYLEDGIQGEEIKTIELPDLASTPEQDLGGRQVHDVLNLEIKRIPPILREVFLLREVEEIPTHEVAQRLGISIAATKSRLLRARLELRTRMERHLGKLGVASLTA